MSDLFSYQGFAYPPYQRPSDWAGTSGTHHDDDDDDEDESDDDGDGDGDDEEYVELFIFICCWVCRLLFDTLIFVCSSSDIQMYMPSFWQMTLRCIHVDFF